MNGIKAVDHFVTGHLSILDVAMQFARWDFA